MFNQAVRRILTINTGSSSLKVALYEMGREATRVLTGEIERIGIPGGRLCVTDADGATLIDEGGDLADHGAALKVMLVWLRRRHELNVSAVGHRVVQGGIHYRLPQRVTSELIAVLQGLIPIAPDHLPQAIQTIQAAVRAFPNLPHVACFDTAFHRHMPWMAQLYPLPRHFVDEGVIRFGFHGLSYEYIVQELRALTPSEAEGRILIAHLGNGASMAAVLGGLDTLVFTGGIGEHAASVRLRICEGLEFLGIHLDLRRNEAHARVISREGSSAIVRVIPTDEDLMIARHTRELMSESS